MKHLLSILILFGFISQVSYASQPIIEKIDEINANVIFMRHALAPGFGDPVNFNLQDCKSQRNLNDAGIEQAQNIGQFFLKNKIIFTEILSSEWCRCIDTALEMNIGATSTFEGLNSFFQGHVNKSDVIKKLNIKLDNLSSKSLILMITHQVVIAEITSISPPSGGIILYNSKNKTAKEFKITDYDQNF